MEDPSLASEILTAQVTDRTMPPLTWSPGILLPGHKIPRRVVVIPSDQQKLHDRPDAWSRWGIPNVPPSVLEDVRKFRVRAQTAPPPVSPTPLQSSREYDEAGHPPSDAGTAMSWESSPIHHKAAPAMLGIFRDASNVRTEPPPQPLSSMPAVSSPSFKLHSRAGWVKVDPPVSSVPESDLEVEEPKAITAPLEPVNRAAAGTALEPTPPSAQITIIPSTYNEHTSPVRRPEPKQPEAKHGPRRRRMIDPAKVHGSDPVSPTHSALELFPVTDRPPMPKESITQDPSRFSKPISPLPPPRDRNRSPPVLAQEVPITSGIQVTANGQHSSSSEFIPPNGPPSQAPYTAFTIAYPDFKGDVQDFIRALMILDDYRRKNTPVPPCLYDDFIRIFCGDYLKYIKTMTITNERALSAADWYHDKVASPVYLKGVITKDNLDDVLDHYSDQIKSFNKELSRIKGKRSSTRSSRRTTSATDTPPMLDKSAPTPSNIKSTSPPAVNEPAIELESPQLEVEPEAATHNQDLSLDPIGFTPPSQTPSRESSRVVSAAPSSRSTTTSVSRPNTFHSLCPSGMERTARPPHPVAGEAMPPPLSRPRPEIRQPIPPSLPPKMNPPTNHLLFKGSTAPSGAPRINDITESPVVSYGKRHSLDVDLLPTTTVPLSQQSNADSIAEPKRKKRRVRDDRWLSERAARFGQHLLKTDPSSSIPGSSST